VVPRAWAIIWLAQAHRDVPAETPADWRERWAAEASAFGQAPPPADFIDPSGLVSPDPEDMVVRHLELAERSMEQSLLLQGAPG